MIQQSADGTVLQLGWLRGESTDQGADSQSCEILVCAEVDSFVMSQQSADQRVLSQHAVS